MRWSASHWAALAIVVAFAVGAWALTRPEADTRTPEETGSALLAIAFDDPQRAFCTAEGNAALNAAVRAHAASLRRKHGPIWWGSHTATGPSTVSFTPGRRIDPVDNAIAVSVFAGVAKESDLYGPMLNAARPLELRQRTNAGLRRMQRGFHSACAETVAFYAAEAANTRQDVALNARLRTARQSHNSGRIHDALDALNTFRERAAQELHALQVTLDAALDAPRTN